MKFQITLSLFLFLLICGNSLAQDYDSICPDCVENPDIDIEFKGGRKAMVQWIEENQQYPEYSISMEDQGKVHISFIVEKNGKVSNVAIYRRVSKELDKEALRLINSMPKWKPAKHDGKRVRTQARIPVIFTLP